mgnify:FL=1
MDILKKVLMVLGGLFLVPVLVISLLLFYWDLRNPPSFEADPVVKLETWTAIPPGDSLATQHNSNTDMIWFRGSFYLVHAQTKWHLEDKDGALLVQRSKDAREWEEVARVTVPGTDVRDPKFAIIKGKLFMYFLPNWSFDPYPTTTYWTVSDDGTRWKEPRELNTVSIYQEGEKGKKQMVQTAGWKLWRPKTRDGKTWYVIASGLKPGTRDLKEKFAEMDVHDITVLLKTTDGVHWEEVSEVYTAHGNGEPCMEFMPNGDIIATLRCGSLGVPGYEFGNPTGNTIIAYSKEPYEEWSYAHSFITRLDGATLFPLKGRIFAVGRNHLGPRTDMGNHLATKRTAFYEVKRDRLIHLFDLPSSGDTAYTGVVQRGNTIYASYYTPPVDKDYPWIVPICFKPKTEIRMAKVSAKGLLEYADRLQSPEKKE